MNLLHRLFPPHEARDELMQLALSDMCKPYADKVWELRGYDPLNERRSTAGMWPFRRASENVIKFPKRGR